MKKLSILSGKTKSILMIFVLLFAAISLSAQQDTCRIQVLTCDDNTGFNVVKLFGVDPWMSINDNNGEYPWQTQYTVDGRREIMREALLATDDYAQMVNCVAGESVTIDVFANDDMITACDRTEIDLFIAQNPKEGTATVDGDNNIVYVPTADFFGRDTLTYTIICDGELYSAQVFITVTECPDNITNINCWDVPDSFTWDIKEAWVSAENDICTYQTPIIGDLDGDGIPEIVVPRLLNTGAGTGSNPANRQFQGIYVFWGDDRDNPHLIPTDIGTFQSQAIAIAKAKINGIEQPFILMLEVTEGRLTAYSPFPANNIATGKTDKGGRPCLWQADPIVGYTNSNINFIGITDFDNCGTPEIYCGNLIYDAATGILLKDDDTHLHFGGSTWEGFNAFNSIASNVMDDGTVNLVAGTHVYKVHINSRTDKTQNYLEIVSSIPPVDIGIGGGVTVEDGFTTVADIDGDGWLDVIFLHSLYHLGSNASATGPGDRCALVVWSPKKQELLGYKVINSHYGDFGVPFIADVDACGELEISFTTTIKFQTWPAIAESGRIESYRWNSVTGLEKVYEAITSDNSGTTGITAFDFNQDGKAELVYRDETHLRIMEAVPPVFPATVGEFKNLHTFPTTSNTGFEMAVVADVDADGSAEIVVVGGTATKAYTGNLRIYKSGNRFPWAPARKVWNQYMYHVVHINEDLTVPTFPMNQAEFLPSGKQPFNNFLQQQTWLNQDGVTFWPAPEVEWYVDMPDFPPAEIKVVGDDAVFTGCIVNIGDAALQNAIYVAFYKDDTTVPNFIALDSINILLLPHEKYCFELTLENYLSYGADSIMLVSINDKGTGTYPYQPQCNVTDRKKFRVPFKATDDYITICHTNTVIDVLDNDAMIACDREDIIMTIVEDSKVGATVSVNGDKDIVYVRATGFVGLDEIKYVALCDDVVYTATVFITVTDDLTQGNPTTGTTICHGATHTFTLAEATGGSGTITYLWQQSTDGDDWEDAAGINDEANYTTPNLTTNMYYRRQASAATCGDPITSDAALVTVTPEFKQNNPISTMSCYDSPYTFTLAAATGGSGTITYLWQQSTDDITWVSATGTNNLRDYTTPTLTTDMYYRRQATAATCGGTITSASAKVTLSPDFKQSAPSAPTPQTFCSAAKVRNLQTNDGVGITWYDDETGDTALPPTYPLTHGAIYYAAQAMHGCSGERTAVKVIIDDEEFVDAPNIPYEVNLCPPATLADVPTNGNTNIKWYDQIVGGNEIVPEDIDIIPGNTYTFYAGLIRGEDCESAQRVEVNIIITTDVDAPEIDPIQHFCTHTLVANLATPNNKIVWYFEETDIEPLEPSTKLITHTYWAAQGAGSCESTERTPVSVVIDQYPAPIAPSPQGLCGKLLYLSDLTITGASIRWYTGPGAGATQLPPKTTEAEAGHTYYATQTAGDCEGERIPIAIVNDCYSPYGTVFPFVHTEDPVFNKQFVTSAKLYSMPPATVIDKIGFIRKQNPIQTVPVTYYDCTDTFKIVGVPKSPGIMGNTDNPNIIKNAVSPTLPPIRWSIIGVTASEILDPELTGPENWCTDAPIGKYIFEDIAPGEYILEIARQGFVTRYGRIIVADNEYLGHREILGGDVNGDLMINEKDLSAIYSKTSTYGKTSYDWKYDINGDGSVNGNDAVIIRVNMNAKSDIYQEAFDIR